MGVNFEPTYKELKLQIPVGNTAGNRDFEPTYKELKQIYAVYIPDEDVDFEPTYKELKLEFFGYCQFWSCLFRAYL